MQFMRRQAFSLARVANCMAFKFSKPYCGGCGLDYVELTSVPWYDLAGQPSHQWLCERCLMISEIWEDFVAQLKWVNIDDPEEE